MPLLPGEILNKRYRIVSLLAEGPYGAVYRAWDIRDERPYAVKEYLDPSPQTQQLFRAEVRRLTGLKHPQLPAVRDHFNLEDTGQYLVSDYVDGPSLQDLLDQYGPLPSDLIVGWLQAACKPLAYLHEKGTVHLNIKPANIRVTAEGEVFLVDTGLPGLGIHVGTGGYASPEQARQEAATAASDIYSLGATLYTLLTGQAPPEALRRESGLHTLVAPRDVNPDVEPYLSLAAMRALDLNPDVRFDSADDFAQAMERPIGRAAYQPTEPRRAPSSQTTTSPPAPRLPQRVRRQMQQRTILGMAALMLLTAVGVAAIFLLSGQFQLANQEPEAATATTQSEIIAALTQLAPTITPSPPPTDTPEPTPAPLLDTRTGARLLYVPGGVFRYGDDEGEDDETPSNVIRVDAFFIDETEVSNGQYQLCVDSGACNPPFNTGATFHPAYYGDPNFDNYPVIFVNWNNADAFCQWRNARLPTEAEWEKAAGYDPVAFVKTVYPWGDEFEGERANFCDASCPADRRNPEFNDGNRDTAPVDDYPEGRSHVGAYNMAGNVMEWVADWYNPDYYFGITQINPLGPLEGDAKSLRGGSWLTAMEDLEVTSRASRVTSVAVAHIGFRCARTPE